MKKINCACVKCGKPISYSAYDTFDNYNLANIPPLIAMATIGAVVICSGCKTKNVFQYDSLGNVAYLESIESTEADE